MSAGRGTPGFLIRACLFVNFALVGSLRLFYLVRGAGVIPAEPSGWGLGWRAIVWLGRQGREVTLRFSRCDIILMPCFKVSIHEFSVFRCRVPLSPLLFLFYCRMYSLGRNLCQAYSLRRSSPTGTRDANPNSGPGNGVAALIW